MKLKQVHKGYKGKESRYIRVIKVKKSRYIWVMKLKQVHKGYKAKSGT